MRRSLPSVLGHLGLGLLLAAAMTSPARGVDEPPNILVFVADDAGWSDFGAYGNRAVRTPSLDALAASGVVFDNAFLTTASCSPSRISILSGRYPHATGAEDLHSPLPEGVELLPSLLGREGYFTGHMRKTHYGPAGERQFDWFSEETWEGLPGFLDEAGERPFFLWVGFRDPHRPYSAGAIDSPHDPAEVFVPPYLVDDAATREDLALYYDEIARMDLRVGRMLAELDRRALRESTLVVFLSDNGAPFPRAKATAYDAGIRTPLIISWPGVAPAGVRYAGLASMIDLAPTLLEAAAAETPASFHGSSFAAALTDQTVPGREYVFAERNWHNCDEHIRTVRGARYKLIRNAYTELPLCTPADASRSASWYSLTARREAGTLTPGQARLFEAPRPVVEVYDLEADPHELVNLAGRPEVERIARQLSRVLDAWIEETEDFPASHRRRADNTDRVTGVKFSQKVPPLEP
ncbi:MAG: sulfatase [Holophagales bacterium]|nr:sulfatase [Holophagales bacterium]MYF04786.1 sulfatase [Holophagales bacterium]MYJ25091.1 sulfatase [Holophagales bacterium]